VLCVRCGERMDFEDLRTTPAEGVLCAPCRMVPPAFERAVAYGEYDDDLREMLHLLKYEGVHGLAEPLGEKLAEAIGSLEEEAGLAGRAGGELVVVAVPLYAAKSRQRGFNQSQVLADAAMKSLKRTKPVWKMCSGHRALRRVRRTETQFGLTPKERRENLRGAFKVTDRAAIAGREVLLIDDIYTTGATARECSAVLRRAGAEKVWVATLARAQREMIARWGETDE
jgi:ComF family protein